MDLWVSFFPESLYYLRSIVAAGNCGIGEKTAAWIQCPHECLFLSPAVFCGVWSCRTSVALEMPELSPCRSKHHLFPCLTPCPCQDVSAALMALGWHLTQWFWAVMHILRHMYQLSCLKGERKVSHDPSTPQGSLQLHFWAASEKKYKFFLVVVYINS